MAYPQRRVEETCCPSSWRTLGLLARQRDLVSGGYSAAD